MSEFLSFGEPLVGFYPAGGTSIADDAPIFKTWGGDTSNFAIGVTRLGHRASFLTRVGDDPFGRGFLSLWEKNGLDVSLVKMDSQRRTGLYFVSFEGGKHSLTYYRRDSAASAMTPGHLENLDFSGIRILHLSGISLGMSASAFEAGLALMQAARREGCRVSFDVNYRSAQWPSAEEASSRLARAISGGTDFLEITDDEMAALDWGSSLEDIVGKFPMVPYVILKRGKAGAAVAAPGISLTVPAFEVDVMDTVGAGDSFDAGFLTAILEGASVRQAARFGAAAAALTCTGRGPLEKMPWRHEVDDFLARHPE